MCKGKMLFSDTAWSFLVRTMIESPDCISFLLLFLFHQTRHWSYFGQEKSNKARWRCVWPFRATRAGETLSEKWMTRGLPKSAKALFSVLRQTVFSGLYDSNYIGLQESRLVCRSKQETYRTWGASRPVVLGCKSQVSASFMHSGKIGIFLERWGLCGLRGKKKTYESSGNCRTVWDGVRPAGQGIEPWVNFNLPVKWAP